jgi:gluconate 5-dehydrogenase
MKISDLFSLKGRTAVVSAGARNFGFYFAQALAEAGATVHLTSRTLSEATKAAQELKQQTGAEVYGHRVDPAEESSVVDFFREVENRSGRCDVLVNNAGGRPPSPLPVNDYANATERHPLETWKAVLDAYLTTSFLMTKHALPLMKRAGRGSIVFVSSVSGLVGRDRTLYAPFPDQNANCVDYSAAKAGMLGFMQDLAAQVGPKGIRVNAISPGGFERGHPKEFVAEYAKRTMLGRMGEDAIDLKGAVVFLASEASRYVTAQNLVVDGGFVSYR